MERTKESESYLAEVDVHQSWEDHYLAPQLEKLYNTLFGRIVESLGAKPGDCVLDAGCGYCHHAARLARAGLDVTGVDFSPAALAEARKHLDREGLSIRLQKGNLLALPFNDRSFPFVVCWGVLMHVPELEVALAELARVLKNGGRLAISENSQTSLHVRAWEPLVRLGKTVLGRATPERKSTDRGIEEWKSEGLMVRKLNFDWLEEFFAARGLKQIDRFAGQFSEIYTNLPKPLKPLAYRLNDFWADHRLPPQLALGNVAIFEKLER